MLSEKFRTYIVTSCKGGIGKSTVSANLAEAMTLIGHRVLTIDCDFSNRSLDLIFGCEDSVVYDISDLVHDKARPGQVVIQVPDRKDLYFIPAPYVNSGMFTHAEFAAAVKSAAELFSCDVVIIDTPGAADWILPVVAAEADAALIVTSHMPTSVRGAERTGVSLDTIGVKDRYLLINRFDSEKVRTGERLGISALIDRTHVKLIGVIPESKSLELAQEKGRLACETGEKNNHAAAAFEEVARRLCGERIPLMSFLPESQRVKLLN